MKKGAATREAIVGRALQQAVAVGLEGLSLGPLADSLELTRERVRQIQLEALGQLRRIIKRRGVSKDVLL